MRIMITAIGLASLLIACAGHPTERGPAASLIDIDALAAEITVTRSLAVADSPQEARDAELVAREN